MGQGSGMGVGDRKGMSKGKKKKKKKRQIKYGSATGGISGFDPRLSCRSVGRQENFFSVVLHCALRARPGLSVCCLLLCLSNLT